MNISSSGGTDRASEPKRIAVAVVERDGQFLIGQRPPGVALAGLWEFPGGKVEPDESAPEAAARECLEETGLPVEPVGELSKVTQQYAHGLVEISFIACRPIGDGSASSMRLHSPFRWVARTDLARYEFPAANAAIVERLIQGG
ncbi:MAG TPA: (deoxy)nucleoside triphosphate pyrophosphohydrolase [Pirellulales bacterium]|jgi:mutator protein MutT